VANGGHVHDSYDFVNHDCYVEAVHRAAVRADANLRELSRLGSNGFHVRRR
jgi:hypothetical protein